MTTATQSRTAPLSDYEFVLAGHAVFTVTSLRTGTEMRFRVTHKVYDDGGEFYFVNVWAQDDDGAQDDDDAQDDKPQPEFMPVGRLFPQTGRMKSTRNSRFPEGTAAFNTAEWLFKMLATKQDFSHVATFHAETVNCCVCGRKLRAKASVDARIGPICAGRFGM